MEEESKQINVKLDHKIEHRMDIESYFKSFEKTFVEKKEYAEGKIKENPLAYMAGAFVGGVIIGYMMMGRGKK